MLYFLLDQLCSLCRHDSGSFIIITQNYLLQDAQDSKIDISSVKSNHSFNLYSTLHSSLQYQVRIGGGCSSLIKKRSVTNYSIECGIMSHLTMCQHGYELHLRRLDTKISLQVSQSIQYDLSLYTKCISI